MRAGGVRIWSGETGVRRQELAVGSWEAGGVERRAILVGRGQETGDKSGGDWKLAIVNCMLGRSGIVARNGEKDRSQESEIRSQEDWKPCAKWLKCGGFAQPIGKIRVFFEGFSNDFERFFAKIDAFRTIFQKNDAILSGFEQV